MKKIVLILLVSLTKPGFYQSVEDLITKGNLLEKQMKETEVKRYCKNKSVNVIL
jgi:hypothetical protein